MIHHCHNYDSTVRNIPISRCRTGIGHGDRECHIKKGNNTSDLTYMLYLHHQYINTDTMDNINMLSDAEITKRISVRLKELRLKQNISRQDISASSGVSVSSVVRMEDGEIKSFESFLRIQGNRELRSS